MSKDEIYEIMADSEGHTVKVVDADGEEYTGIVDLFESREDNEGDDACPGEGSICVDEPDGNTTMLFERDIKEMEILD